MILHSDRYESGDRLSEEHERTIVDRLLVYHPDFDKKIDIIFMLGIILILQTRDVCSLFEKMVNRLTFLIGNA
uniref:Uncharacterized protein n=1 Tax=Salix viminalis TaxID=40686 RepID=A0A6N2MFW2_SALVM